MQSAIPGNVGWWPINEGSGSTLVDYSPSGKNMTISGSPVWTNGLLGGELLFTAASSQYAATATALVLTNYTLSVWAYHSNTTGNQVEINDGNSSASGMLTYCGGGTLYAQNSGSGGTTGLIISAGVWYHICVTYNGTAINVYTNGVYAQTKTTSLTAPSGYESIAGAQGSYFSGGISDPRIYNRALGTNEIWLLYGAGRGCGTQ